MVFILTSNPVDLKRLQDYHENFMIVLTEQTNIVPLSSSGYKFRVYHQEGMSLDDYEDYENEGNKQYEFYPTQTILTAIDSISNHIIEYYEHDREQSEDNQEEIMVVVACQYSWNRKIAEYLSHIFEERNVDIVPLDIYRYMHFGSQSRLVDYLKFALNTNIIYPEDPIQFGYALMRTFGGLVR